MNNGLTFSSKDCIEAADKLQASAQKLETILNTNIKNLMKNADGAYKSEGATEIQGAFNSVSAKFPEFINSIKRCADYLKTEVAPSYEAIERKVQQNVQ